MMRYAYMTNASARGVGLVVSVGNIQNERTPSRYFYFVLLARVRPLTGESSLTCNDQNLTLRQVVYNISRYRPLVSLSSPVFSPLLIFPRIVSWAYRITPNFCITTIQTRTILHSPLLSYRCVGFPMGLGFLHYPHSRLATHTFIFMIP